MDKTIRETMKDYLKTVQQARSPHTATTYAHALNFYYDTLCNHHLDPQETKIDDLTEDSILWLTEALKNHAATTERLYLTAVTRYFEYLVAERLTDINLPRVRLLIQQRARKPGQRLPQFPSSQIDQILEKAEQLLTKPVEDSNQRLVNLRDRAFLYTLADTGLRVHEACNLRRGDLDWNEGKAMIIGKGNRQDIVRFSTRSTTALVEYLQARATIDGNTGKPLSSLPIFARHDRGAGKKTKSITPTTGRNIIAARVKEFIGPEAVGTITPHSFRHYFVTKVLRSSGNLKLAQELARHKNIAVTQRYAHLSDDELDKGYWEAIEEKS